MSCSGNCEACANKGSCDNIPANHQQEGGCSPDKCANCPSRGHCSQSNEPTEDTLKIAKRLEIFDKILIVCSGKGGVGKSSVACQLSYALSENKGINVSLLDVDICGPSIPTMTCTTGEEIHESADGWAPVNVTDKLQVMSVGYMLRNQDDAVIMRGPKKHGVILQFLEEVDWEKQQNKHFLIIDTPPGTSDEHLSTINLISTACRFAQKKPDLSAVIVTTPQEVALADVRKEINFCKQIGLPVRGVIENMSGFVCPCCGKRSELFMASTGGAEHMCKQFQIELLGKIPMDPLLTQASEEGMPWAIICENKQITSVGLEMFNALVDKLAQ